MRTRRVQGIGSEDGGELRAALRRRSPRIPRWAGKALLRAASVSLVLVVLGPVSSAMAEAKVTIAGPNNVTNDPTPSFSGEITGLPEEEGGESTAALTLTISGHTVAGLPVQSSQPVPLAASGLGIDTWTVSPEHLADGTYTAQATLGEPLAEAATSPPVTFTVDTTPPNVTLTSPANDIVMSGGSQF